MNDNQFRAASCAESMWCQSRVALERLPDMVVTLSKCTRSASIDSGVAVFAYRALETLLHHFRFVYDMYDTSNPPDAALARPYGPVGPSAGTDTCRSRFDSSATARWVRVVRR